MNEMLCSARRPVVFFFLAIALSTLTVLGQVPQVVSAPHLNLPEPFVPLERYGPYNAHLLVGGRGLTKSLPAADPLLQAEAPWTLSAWVQVAAASPTTVAIAGVGDPADVDSRFFWLIGGKPAFRAGEGRGLTAAAPMANSGWHLLAATFDGDLTRLFVDGALAASGRLATGAVGSQLSLGPVQASCAKLPCPHFGGYLAEFTLVRGAASRDAVATMAKDAPDAELIAFEEGSKPWPLQVVQFAGNTAPQEPWTMPKRNAPFSKPKAVPAPAAATALVEQAPGDWVLAGGWKLAEAPKVTATPEQIASAGFDTAGWMAATVPGTVLTTMIDRGSYPDPDYGLDNLAIPERLNRQDYWYRTEFAAPALDGRRNVAIRLDGINYRAEVWFNGQQLGEVNGAFTRGTFEIGKLLRADGSNALAIRIAPPPHVGIPNVQSIALGAGLNGGAMELDGPTFMASEGWDWNPPMHDRDTGLWQDVHLLATGPVTIGDEQVVTKLPLPDISSADVTLNIPLGNDSGAAVEGVLTAAFDGVEVRKRVTVSAGGTTVRLAPSEFVALHLEHPRLWWPNGYGKPELYRLTLRFEPMNGAATEKRSRFGVRELSYEVSLLDGAGALRRVDYDPTVGRESETPQVESRHEGMRQVAGGWAASIAAGQEDSPVFRRVEDTRATPYLTIKVNGVRIAVRGGSWGMDDSRKRVSREHLEPFFRYDRDANLDVIRNWQGQNTEEVFYDLADEYGILVWNDFWEVTTDSNAEADDPQLFLANAKDTILRYRNHPSIAMWCGRNEGVPQPAINEGLIALTHGLDGTRYYSPSSNEVNLQPSGPYSYEDPADYYTKLDPGFAVEVGTPSLPTLEWFDRWIPKVDQWPITDDWAYHNWHPHDEFNRHMQAEFGAASSLKEYERQAQMMNYVDYRAIFEGFNAHLWAPNTGRLLWMTQPSWPSMLWGILSSDYDTHASYYGTKKACEPVHVQLDLATGDVEAIDTTREPVLDARVEAAVYSLTGKLLLHREATVDVAANEATGALRLELAPLLGETTVLVKLALRGPDGKLLSENLYWRAASDAGYRALNDLPGEPLILTAQHVAGDPKGARIEVTLKNAGLVAALNTKIVTLRAADGTEVLPAFYSDNYVSLLPGEERTVTVDLPGVAAKDALAIRIYGWNAVETRATVAP